MTSETLCWVSWVSWTKFWWEASLMRDLTATGFFTSEIGIKDLGYAGNKPNQWDGVPQDVLDKYGLKYDDKTLEISVKFES